MLDLRILLKVLPAVLDVKNVSEAGEATCSRFQGTRGRRIEADVNVASLRADFRRRPLPLRPCGPGSPEGASRPGHFPTSSTCSSALQSLNGTKLRHPDCRSRVHAAQHKESGELAGIICSQTFRYRLGHTEQLVDLLVSGGTYAPFRRMGLFSRLVNVIVEHGGSLGVTCGISFPNPYVRNSFPAFMKAGWSVPVEYRFFEKRSFRGSIAGVKPIDHFDERFDRFMEAASTEYDFFQMKDHRVLDWRYSARPENDIYRVRG